MIPLDDSFSPVVTHFNVRMTFGAEAHRMAIREMLRPL